MKLIRKLLRWLRVAKEERTAEIAAEFSAITARFEAAHDRSAAAANRLASELEFHHREIAVASNYAANLKVLGNGRLVTQPAPKEK